MEETNSHTDVQLKQVLAEETYWPNDWPAQVEYYATAQCCWSESEYGDFPEYDEDGNVIDEEQDSDTEPFIDHEALLVSGRLLPFHEFRANSL